MKADAYRNDEPVILELERLLNEFKVRFEAGTNDVEKFMSINEIEKLWSELRKNTDALYSDMVQKLILSIDERDIVRKKKESI